jgi:hypothetical protein
MQLRLGWMTLVLPAALVAAGCSTYSAQAPLIRDALIAEDYDKAIKLTDKISKSNSELLYCYELGTILHEQGDYVASNATFERAEQVFDELYTKSISREVGAALVNENIVKYRGDPFEAVLVNYYKILTTSSCKRPLTPWWSAAVSIRSSRSSRRRRDVLRERSVPPVPDGARIRPGRRKRERRSLLPHRLPAIRERFDHRGAALAALRRRRERAPRG